MKLRQMGDLWIGYEELRSGYARRRICHVLEASCVVLNWIRVYKMLWIAKASWLHLCHPTFAMSGALAWQVKNRSSIKSLFCGFWRGDRMGYYFSRVLLSSVRVLRPLSLFPLPLSLNSYISVHITSNIDHKQTIWSRGRYRITCPTKPRITSGTYEHIYIQFLKYNNHLH